eukprot:COSAG01_NODE_15178_length_1364_cov_9.535968_1_plen_234_part_00
MHHHVPLIPKSCVSSSVMRRLLDCLLPSLGPTPSLCLRFVWIDAANVYRYNNTDGIRLRVYVMAHSRSVCVDSAPADGCSYNSGLPARTARVLAKGHSKQQADRGSPVAQPVHISKCLFYCTSAAFLHAAELLAAATHFTVDTQHVEPHSLRQRPAQAQGTRQAPRVSTLTTCCAPSRPDSEPQPPRTQSHAGHTDLHWPTVTWSPSLMPMKAGDTCAGVFLCRFSYRLYFLM